MVYWKILGSNCDFGKGLRLICNFGKLCLWLVDPRIGLNVWNLSWGFASIGLKLWEICWFEAFMLKQISDWAHFVHKNWAWFCLTAGLKVKNVRFKGWAKWLDWFETIPKLGFGVDWAKWIWCQSLEASLVY